MTALTRLLASSPFRVTLAYIGAFVLAAALIVGFISWRANELLTTQVIETLSAEVVGLREQFQAGGAARLRDVINERTAEPGSSLYLLVDAAGRKGAGNLARVPVELADGGRGLFRYMRTTDALAGKERLAVGVSLAVPGGLTPRRRPRHRGPAPVRRHHVAGGTVERRPALRARHRRRPADQP